MTEIPLALNNIVNHLTKLNRPVVSQLRAGLPPQKISSMLERVGLEPTNQLVELYSINDGTDIVDGDVLDDSHFFPGFYWCSLDESVENYVAFRDDARWNARWLPIFANGGGDFAVVICDKSSALDGHIVDFLLGEPDQMTEYRSIEAMLKTIDACFREGIFYAEGGYLEADFSRMTEVGRTVDPAFIPEIVK